MNLSMMLLVWKREAGSVKTSQERTDQGGGGEGGSAMIIHIFVLSGKMWRKMFSKENDYIFSKVDLVENGEISQEF